MKNAVLRANALADGRPVFRIGPMGFKVVVNLDGKAVWVGGPRDGKPVPSALARSWGAHHLPHFDRPSHVLPCG